MKGRHGAGCLLGEPVLGPPSLLSCAGHSWVRKFTLYA